MTTCCFCKHIKEEDPKEFDLNDIYQQIEIVPHKTEGFFTAKSVAYDSFAPWLLRQKYWTVYTSKPKGGILAEASGFNKALYEQRLEIDFPISALEASKLDIGKWYSPFMFIKEEISLKDQVQRSAYYEISLEQFWEQVYIAENLYGTDKSVNVQAIIQANRVLLNGKEARQDEARNKNGIKWFKDLNSGEKVGISAALWDRFRWEQERRGWVSDQVNINKVEVYAGVQTWKTYCCYVLVERFTVKRMDGSLALTVDFKHTNKVQNKWE